jgi:hypothetical protein
MCVYMTTRYVVHAWPPASVLLRQQLHVSWCGTEHRVSGWRTVS